MKQKLLVGTLLFGVLPFLMGPTCTLVNCVANPPIPPPNGPQASRVIYADGTYDLSNPPSTPPYYFEAVRFKATHATAQPWDGNAAYASPNWNCYTTNPNFLDQAGVPGDWTCYGYVRYRLYYIGPGGQYPGPPLDYNSSSTTVTVKF